MVCSTHKDLKSPLPPFFKGGSERGNTTFWALIGIFFLPMMLAIILYSTRHHWELKSKTEGELLTPSLTIPLDLSNEPRLWRVIYITPNCVDANCELQLAKIESVHEATGKDFDRVSAMLITTTDEVNPQFLEQFKQIPWKQLHSQTEIPMGLFIMDPNGYIILKYALDRPGVTILDDLRHLLKVSQIG